VVKLKFELSLNKPENHETNNQKFCGHMAKLLKHCWRNFVLRGRKHLEQHEKSLLSTRRKASGTKIENKNIFIWHIEMAVLERVSSYIVSSLKYKGLDEDCCMKLVHDVQISHLDNNVIFGVFCGETMREIINVCLNKMKERSTCCPRASLVRKTSMTLVETAP
jgi:hypothetical protein